jgi:hypothetical protein
MYYQPSTNQVFTLHAEIRSALWASASVILDSVITDTALADVGVFKLRSERPSVQPGEIAEPSAFELLDDAWVQQWTVRATTPAEQATIDEATKLPVPQQISSGQGREALYNVGLFANVQPSIDAIEDTDTKWRVQNAWDYRPTWERQSPFVAMMAGILGLDDEALDQLFIDAALL